jgi:hypothetical protein
VTLSDTGNGSRETLAPNTLFIPDCGIGEITSPTTFIQDRDINLIYFYK